LVVLTRTASIACHFLLEKLFLAGGKGRSLEEDAGRLGVESTDQQCDIHAAAIWQGHGLLAGATSEDANRNLGGESYTVQEPGINAVHSIALLS
jgi:hypothetical protein